MEVKKYSKLYRTLHWAMAISFMLLLITIFLRLTWMNKYNVAEIIQNYLSDTGREPIGQKDLIILAKKIRQPMWDWHIYIGYFLTGLFSVRFILPFFGKMKFQSPFEEGLTGKEKFQKWTYLVFYFCVVVSLVTGLIIEFGPKEYKKFMESIHELGLYYLVGYMVIHFAGVFMAEFSDQKGIVSRIVSGSKEDD